MPFSKNRVASDNQEIGKLRDNLKNMKVFMNMVIHDLRNPTNQIKYGVDQAFSQVTILEE